MASILRPLFPVGLDLANRPVLVIGGRSEAVDKTSRLFAAQARITVVSPRADSQIQRWADADRLRWYRRIVEPGDLTGCRLVLNTLKADNSAHRSIVAWARRERVLISTYDQPDRSDIGMPAEVSRGHLRIAIATSNASPTLASLLRGEIERLIDNSELVAFLDDLGKLRQEVREYVSDGKQRRVLLRQAAAGVTLAGSFQLPAEWRERLADVRKRLYMLRSDDK